VRDITEEVLLAYFEQESRKLKGSTFLNADVYNPIKEKYRNQQICKPDNVHQKKINRSGYEEIRHFYQAGDRNVPEGSG
jgi:hypothetical protein